MTGSRAEGALPCRIGNEIVIKGDMGHKGIAPYRLFIDP